MRTFAVLPNITTDACAGQENNDPQHPGCDAVPTGMATGRDGSVYVSGLSGETPGEGRVYRLDARTGRILQTWSGLTGPTGVAVGSDGSIYASELFNGAPEGEPGPDFDPTKVGRIVRIAPSGARTYAQVTQRTGLLWHRGTLYASAGSIYSFIGVPHGGQVVSVSPGAFRAP